MRYVKLDLSFGDKLRLLFLGVVAENKLPEVVRIVHPQENCIPEKPVAQAIIERAPSINTTEAETFNIPFFDLGDEDTKSNF